MHYVEDVRPTKTLVETMEQTPQQMIDEISGYKADPSEEEKKRLQSRFDEIFTQKTCYASLNLAIERLYKNKQELLLGDLSDSVDNFTAGAGLLPGSVLPGGRYTGKMPVPPFRRRKL